MSEIYQLFLIILDVLLLWVENVALKIVKRTTICWIRWEYLDYQKDAEERLHWFSILEIIHETQLPLFACEQRWSESFETQIYCGKDRL